MAGKKKKTNEGTGPETFSFQTEVQQLLHLMIHSLYSHKEIFLRELVSNASDALDRRRFEALTKPELLGEDVKLGIRLETDLEARTLTIHDTGIGMSRQEVIDHIGTIAKSGTRELADRLRESQGMQNLGELIGQFGVGFYSSFMVADEVELTTRRADEEGATRWRSKGEGKYEVSPGERDAPGTSITLHLKSPDEEQGLEDFTDEGMIASIVKRYSDFIAYPIVLVGKEGERTLNSMKPIWERPPGEVKEEEYAEFYKHVAHDWRDPLETILQRAEGILEYKALLFIPSEAPFDLYYVGYEPGLRLYARRVQIMERCKDLLPRYLRFVQGIVDSSDLPLNVSREMLQHDRQIRQIRKGLVKKILDTLGSMKEKEEEKYLTFWRELGRAFKEGLSEDFENKDKIANLLLFQSTQDREKLTSLADYVSRMKAEQDAIYYLAGGPRAVLESSPHLETFRDRGVEVLLLTEAVDELLVQALPEFEGKKLKSIGAGAVELGSDTEREAARKELDEKAKTFEPFLTRLKDVLEDRVEAVRLSERLTTSPACLVGGEDQFSPRLEKWLREERDLPARKRILELNPSHEIVAELEARFEADAEDALVSDYAELLYGYALLAEGSELPDPAGFARRFSELMRKGLSASSG